MKITRTPIRERGPYPVRSLKIESTGELTTRPMRP